MTTSAHIGILDPDKTITYVYLHHDGYPSHAGKILERHYTTVDEVKALINLGSMSSIGKSLDSCEFYQRDLGEELELMSGKMSIRDFANEGSVEYTYLFINGVWHRYGEPGNNHGECLEE